MAASSSTVLSKRFRGSTRSLGHYVLRAEGAAQDGHLAERDLRLAYSGGVLSFTNDLESLVESLFFGLLVGTRFSKPKTYSRFEVKSHAVARDLIGGERPFVEWLPFAKTRARADVVFRDGHAFSRLTPNQIDALEQLRYIRNAIAHSGESAQRKFEQHVLGNLPVVGPQRTPVGFLRGLHAPGQTRFENLVLRVSNCVDTLCA